MAPLSSLHPSSLFWSSSSNESAMPSKHINRKCIPRCLLLSWPPTDNDNRHQLPDHNRYYCYHHYRCCRCCCPWLLPPMLLPTLPLRLLPPQFLRDRPDTDSTVPILVTPWSKRGLIKV
jgi:hypothetical protein